MNTYNIEIALPGCDIVEESIEATEFCTDGGSVIFYNSMKKIAAYPAAYTIVKLVIDEKS